MKSNYTTIYITLEDVSKPEVVAKLVIEALKTSNAYALRGASQEAEDALQVPGTRTELIKAIVAEINKSKPQIKI